MSKIYLVGLPALFLNYSPWLDAATCSCASVPLASNLQSGGTAQNSLVLGVTWERHDMNDLVAGSEVVTDETERRRASEAILLELGYGFAQDWSVSFLTNYIEHSRQIGVNSVTEENSRGLGDSLLLFKYVPQTISVYNRHEYGVGAGLKFGAGETQQKSSSGIRLSEDMQPSTGADGTVLWSYYALAFSREARNTLHLTFNVSFNQKNDQGYRVGDDINLGFGWQSLLNNDWRSNLQLNFRNANADKRFGNAIPNTGGQWLDLLTSVQYRITDDMGVRFSYRLPLHRELEGSLQFTTSSAMSLGIVMHF